MERKWGPCLAKIDRDGNLVIDAILPPKMGRMAKLSAFCSRCLMNGAGGVDDRGGVRVCVLMVGNDMGGKSFKAGSDHGGDDIEEDLEKTNGTLTSFAAYHAT